MLWLQHDPCVPLLLLRAEDGEDDSARAGRGPWNPEAASLVAEGKSYESILSLRLQQQCGLDGQDWVSVDIHQG